MLSRKAVCLWLLGGTVCVALAAGGAGLAQQSGPGAPAANPFIAAQPGGPMIAQGGGAVAAMGGSPPPAKRPPVPPQPGYQAGAEGGYGGYGGYGIYGPPPEDRHAPEAGGYGGYGGYGIYGGRGRGASGYASLQAGDNARYPDPYTYFKARQPDPEMEELLRKDAEMEGQAQVLVGQWHEEKDEKARGDLRSRVEKLAKEHFDLRQQRRELELSRLEAQLERVRTSIKKRSEVKDLIIQRRIARLLGEEDDLAF